MMNGALFTRSLELLAEEFQALPDKPNETPESTLRAIWFAAAGNPRGIERSQATDLPTLDEKGRSRLAEMIAQRRAGVPLAHLTGRQDFLGIEFLVSPDALIPRRETEILGRAVLGLLSEFRRNGSPLTIVDVCTGSGNLALAFAHHDPECEVHAADLSPEAVALASRNAAALGLEDRVRFHTGDLFEPFVTELKNRVDVISCNPPYISSARISEMPDEISNHEPQVAFDGGPFGIRILSRLVKESQRLLKSGSWLCFEVGRGQGPGAQKLLAGSPAFEEVRTYHDDDGEIRALAARTGQPDS